MSAAFASKLKELSEKLDVLFESDKLTHQVFKLLSEQHERQLNMLSILERRVFALESRNSGNTQENAQHNRRNRAAGKAGEQ